VACRCTHCVFQAVLSASTSGSSQHDARSTPSAASPRAHTDQPLNAPMLTSSVRQDALPILQDRSPVLSSPHVLRSRQMPLLPQSTSHDRTRLQSLQLLSPRQDRSQAEGMLFVVLQRLTLPLQPFTDFASNAARKRFQCGGKWLTYKFTKCAAQLPT
jgi:hypothetical protein